MSNYINKELNISNNSSRRKIRKEVVLEFLKEKAGSGSGDKASRYKYFVEELSDNKKIFLTRPANRKLGFDFLIHVEDINFDKKKKRRRNYPKHDDIFLDLNNKKNENSSTYKKLYSEILKIYNCNGKLKNNYNHLQFQGGYSVKLVLGVLKWFFIEQDIRFWNYSGREMPLKGVPKP